jgi:DNA (cytosine-5)-methyltransferase 1
MRRSKPHLPPHPIRTTKSVMTKPTFGSLFAGVGGFDLGFESAGYECRFQVEWDKNCQQTLAYHWPDVPRWGDVCDVNGADLPPVDVITYGFPCQDLSVAGSRAGLDGDRSNLFFQAVRIIKEMRAATNGLHPTWAVAENVPGLLNADGGSAMARVLDALAEAGAMVIEWCVLDAQWFGVPQRRRRVFVAACFDSGVAGRCPNPLFPVAKSGARNPPPCNQARETVAATNENSIVSFDTQFGSNANVFDNLSPTLKSTQTSPSIANNLAVRRLTPLECERLQGFPDNHTLHRADGKTNSDSSRYKQCGNGVAAPVAKWIAEKLKDTL